MEADRPALKDAIEVTEEMMEAGLAEFRSYDRRFDSDEEVVRAIYVAMARAQAIDQIV